MKLGEALSLRARQAQRLDDLRARIRANALVRQGEEATEDPEGLISEYEGLSDEHATLVEQIIRTNLGAATEGGENLLAVLHQREALKRRRNIHVFAADSGTPNRNQYGFRSSELPYESQVNVQGHRATADELDEQIRALDAQIQQANWQVDLVE